MHTDLPREDFVGWGSWGFITRPPTPLPPLETRRFWTDSLHSCLLPPRDLISQCSFLLRFLCFFFFLFLNPVCVGKTESLNSLVKTINYFVLQRCIVILWLSPFSVPQGPWVRGWIGTTRMRWKGLTSSGKNFLISPLCSTWIFGLPPSSTTWKWIFSIEHIKFIKPRPC